MGLGHVGFIEFVGLIGFRVEGLGFTGLGFEGLWV